MDYISIKEASDKWGLSEKKIQTLCDEKQIDGAIYFDGVWAIPSMDQRPIGHNIKSERYIQKRKDYATPILKWAGGKTQLLSEIVDRMPKSYNQYIEPFLGGGALFFKLNAPKAIIADSNPELINMYIEVAKHAERVIEILHEYKNDKEMFYEVRAKNWMECDKTEAAARMIYLNRTCLMDYID